MFPLKVQWLFEATFYSKKSSNIPEKNDDKCSCKNSQKNKAVNIIYLKYF